MPILMCELVMIRPRKKRTATTYRIVVVVIFPIDESVPNHPRKGSLPVSVVADITRAAQAAADIVPPNPYLAENFMQLLHPLTLHHLPVGTIPAVLTYILVVLLITVNTNLHFY